VPIFSPQALENALSASLPAAFAGTFCVAFSGGLDSAVLLHALTELRGRNSRWRLRAVHIDHQLQPQSGDWAAQCRHVAESLDVELTVERVTIDSNDAMGLEAAARAARYAVFRRSLDHGEVLLTAHHADDQAETVLLALMRGSGVQGLAGMPAKKFFALGWHVRPLLGFTREELDAWARERGLTSIVDPSNALLRHDRNYLRHEVLPKLRARWPSASGSITRSASHLGEALELLEQRAAADLQSCALERCLKVDALRRLTPSRRRNVLRYWLRLRGLPLPSTRKLAGLEHDLLNTDLDRMPCVKWQGAELHWHRGLLYADAANEMLDNTENFERGWDWRSAIELPDCSGRLTLSPTSGPGLAVSRLPERLTVRYRRGGERIQLPGRQHRHTLRNLLQEGDVLPWRRDQIPLIFADKTLIAVGDLAWSGEFAATPGEAALEVVWDRAPQWRAVDLGRESQGV